MTSWPCWRCSATILLGLSLAACGGAPPPPAPRPRLVRYQEISVADAGRLRSFAGIAWSETDPRLSFKVEGTIISLPAKVGQRVAAGEVIAEIDPTDFHLSLQDAEAGLRRAGAEARNTEATFRRTRDLYENGNASRTDYDAARAGAESSQAGVESAEQRLALARHQLDYTKLRAPVAGIIASVSAVVNENVRAGQEIVMFLDASSSLEVEIAMPESLIGHCRSGDPVTVRFDALPGDSFSANVTEVGVAATGSGTTFPVTVRLSDVDPNIRAGMSAEVAFRFERKGTAGHLVLPTHAVGEDRKGRFVFVIESSDAGRGVARRRGVEIGELTASGLKIISGVVDGEHIVTAGIGSLTDGETVRFEPSA